MSSTIAEILWVYYESIAKVNPTASWADVFYLLFYPLFFLGIINLPFTPVKKQERIFLALDSSIVTIAAALMLFYTILAPILASLDSQKITDAILLILYPLADLFLLIGFFFLLQRDVERVHRRVLIYLGISMSLTAIPDFIYAYNQTYDLSYQMGPLNLLWIASALAMLCAVASQTDGSPVLATESIPFRPFIRDIILYSGPVSAFFILFISDTKDRNGDYLLHLVALLTTIFIGILVLIRQHLVIVENHKLYRAMERLARIDSLTGLNNRRSLDFMLDQEISRSERFSHTFSILMMDIDHFKRCNDQFGHLAGDSILQRIAELLHSHMRATDFIARFGGDEFVAILPETRYENAMGVGMKLRNLAIKCFQKEKIGLSVGVATWRRGMSAEDLLNAADCELYKVKPERG